MKIILDELTPKEFFSNGGIVKIQIDPNLFKQKKNKFLFYEYRGYIRFLREIYLKYMSIYSDMTPQEVYGKVNSFVKIQCTIGTKEYTIDPNFDGVGSLEFCNFYYCYDNDFFEKSTQQKTDVYKMENVNFSTIDINDSNWNIYEKQRLERGFDDSELWCLNNTTSSFILPRLKAFKEKHFSTPENMTSDEWDNILERIIIAFEIVRKDDPTEEEMYKMECGLKLFARYLKNMWD